MKEIEVRVHLRDGEAPRVIAIDENATIEQLLTRVAGKEDHGMYLIVGDEDEHRHGHHRLDECGIRHGHEVHGHPHAIDYTVDGEPQVSERPKLTAGQILAKAGVDAKTHYLALLLPQGGDKPYKNPDEIIHLRCGMRFITPLVGPTPVS